MTEIAEPPLDHHDVSEPADPAVEAEPSGFDPARVLTLIGVLVAMTILGGWELLLIVGILVAFIVIHEAGHYLTTRWSGMKATEFFIGFGPHIASVKRGETTYGIKALPFGAYVRIIGMNNLEEVDPEDEHRAYRNAAWHKRFLTVAAGPATHFILAVLLAGVAIWQFGEAVEDRWQVDEIIPFSAAEDAGLQAGDEILAIDGSSTVEFESLSSVVTGVKGELVQLDVDRDGEVLSLDARIGERLTPIGSRGYSGLYEGDLVLAFDGQPVANYEEFASLAEQRIGESVEVDVVYDASRHTELITVNEVVREDAVVGFLGVARGEVREPLPLSEAAREAGPVVWRGTRELAARFGTLFTSSDGLRGLFALPPLDDPEPGSVVEFVNDPDQIRPRPELDENRLLSIVGAVGIGQQLVSEGFATVLIFFVGLNISLGLLNLVPLLPFDGGHMAIATYERLRSFGGRRHRVDANRLLPLTYAVLAFMLLVGGIAIIRDIVDPIQL
ncbi:MAG: site-2 protease family protein [Acidimicrobiales bacterium]